MRGSHRIQILALVLIVWGCSGDKASRVEVGKGSDGKKEDVTDVSKLIAQQVEMISEPQEEMEEDEEELSSGMGNHSGVVMIARERVSIVEVGIEPSTPVAGDSLKAKILMADGGASWAGFRYRWLINGRVVQESGESVLSSRTKRGDHVSVEVCPANEDCGSEFVSSSVQVDNSPPRMRRVEQRMKDNGAYEARIEASDPDGDNVSFALKSGPPGMVVDSSSGAIHWRSGPDGGGSFGVEVAARDAQGAESLLSYQINIRWETEGGGK